VFINVWAGLPVSYTWKSAVSSNWSFAGNWTSGAPGAAGQPYYTLNFTPSGTYSVTNDLNNGFVLNQLNVAGTVTFAGPNSPAFTANGPILPQINQKSANTVTFTVPLTLAAMTALGGTGGGQVTFSSVISGAGGLTINTLAPVKFSNVANTYGGGTVINAGPVSFPTAGNGSVTPYFGTGPITLNSNGELQVNRTYLTNSITLNGGTVSGGNSFQSIFSSPVTLSGITTFSFGTTGGFKITGNMSGPGGLTTIGTTTWNLNGNNTYTGPTTIQAGTLSYDTSSSVSPGALSVSDGAVAKLNYTGNRTIAGLTLGGTNMTPGTYGSTSSSATYKDSHFSGNGTVTVSALIAISNSPATAITSSAATLNATLGCAATNAAVLVYWNTVNGGTSPSLWTNSAYLGSWTNVASTNLSRAVSSLAPGTTYYFTFRATNLAYNAWATNVQSFATLPLPGPVVDNANGATNLAVAVAQLRGTLSNGPANVRLYWGTADGGTVPASWANTNLLLGAASGSFSSGVSNLLYGLTYYYRCYASNQWGTAWAPATTNFTTLRPSSTLANSTATGITTNSASLNATLACTGAVYSISAYWNGINGGTNAALWTNSAFVGTWTNVASTNLTLAVTGLPPNTAYYFTFRATNALDSFWATNVQSFTTLSLPAPVVDNAGGATNLAAGVAQLWGSLNNGPADMRLYWGTTDGGTNRANWANANLLGSLPSGSFSGNVSNLLYGLTYYYRAYASNQWGTAWAPAAASFTTLKPLGVSAGQIPYASLIEVSASSETSGYGVTNAFNGNGLLGDGTHGTYGEWLSGSAPVTSQWLKVRFDQTYSLDYLRVWAFNEGTAFCVTNSDVYVLDSDIDPGNNVHLGGGPFNATGWNLALAQQAFAPSPGGGPETNTDPRISLSGVKARQLAVKVNAVVQDYGLAGFGEVQIYRLAPTPISLTNSAATGVTATTAGLNGMLACAGAAYDVYALWNTANGGTNTALWTNSAYIGTWSDVALTNLSYTATGLAPSTPYYFAFRATNAMDSLWATNVLSFTTLAQVLPPTPMLPGSAITVTGGVPSLSFDTVSGFKYRLVYKNKLPDAVWQPVLAPPSFAPPDGWSATANGAPMSLSDTNADGQVQRYYRLETAKP
jgi:autotransporter-associated beta strand protein